jgi:hypothetical protein
MSDGSGSPPKYSQLPDAPAPSTMTAQQRPPGQISIASIDDNTTVVAQYNPKELQVDKSIPWSKVNQANNANTQGIHLEFTGAEGRSVTVELLFDGYETNQPIDKQVAALETLASVWRPDSKLENERRPHRCVATWGSTLPGFRCVIETLSTKYTMFDKDGKPLRATCTVKLKEANVLSVAKGK